MPRLLISLIFLLGMLSAATAVATEKVLFSDYIQQVKKDFEHEQASECSFEPRISTDMGYSSDPVLSEQPVTKDFCENLSAEKVCSDVARECKRTTGSDICHIQNRSEASQRLKSAELRHRVYLEAANLFYNKVLKDEAFFSRCCKGNQECRKNLQNTKLYILKGMPEDLFYGEFFSGKKVTTPHIEFSEANFMFCHTRGCIESSLYHEMGHSCALSNGVDFQDCYGQKENRKGLFEKVFNASVADCAAKYIDKTMQSYNQENPNFYACENGRYNELFAEAMVIDKFVGEDLSRLGLFCAHRIEDMHGPSEGIMDCILKDKPTRDTYCAVKGKQ